MKNQLFKVVSKIFTGAFGKLLIPITFISYYFTESFYLQLLLLGILYLCTSLNYRKVKPTQIKFNL